MNSENIIEKELLEKGSYAACAVGTSMLPMLRDGRDMIIVVPPKDELRKYDVILYRDALGRYVLHRIVKIKDGDYITRGDNTYTDEYIPKSDVLGVLVAFNKNGKRHSVSDIGYKLYSRRRVFFYPVRKFAVRIKAKLFK